MFAVEIIALIRVNKVNKLSIASRLAIKRGAL
jgi:hypothetical protein